MKFAVVLATLVLVAAISLHAEARSVAEYRDDSIDDSYAESAEEDISLRVRTV
jgi:Tfp pilus assembly protein PilX